MKFGLMFANTGRFATADGARAIATAAENAGFESIWTVEHVLVPIGYESEYPYDKSGKMPGGETTDFPDPLVWLSFVAACTSTIKLATGIVIVPQRNPGVLAKEVATLDKLSNGRLLLGVGAGWLEEEFDALGIPFRRSRQAPRRVRRTPCASCGRATTRATPASSRASSPWCRGRDPIDGSVPIVIGGHTRGRGASGRTAR